MKKINRLIPILLVFGLWWVGSGFINSLFLPSPPKVFNTMQDLVENGVLVKSLAASFFRITIATVISCLISIPLGLLVVNYGWARALITPLTNISRFVPITVFYPLLIMWLGINEEMKISFLFIATFLYFLPAVILCMEETDRLLIETALTMGMTRFQLMTKVILPSAMPAILKSILAMYGIGWTYVIIAEVVNTHYGLGHLMHIGSARGKTEMVFAAILTIVLISYIFDLVGNLIVKKSFGWKTATAMEDGT